MLRKPVGAGTLNRVSNAGGSLALLFGALALSACSDGDGPTGPGSPETLSVVSGDRQSGTVGNEVSRAIRVRVQDADGEGVGDVPITWAVVEGGGEVHPVAEVTDSTGEASADWTLGTDVGTQTLEVEADDAGSTEVSADALAGSVAELQLEEGDSQTGVQGMALSEAPAVQAFDAFGNPAKGRTAHFRVEEGGGWTVEGSVPFDEEGRASTPWYLGPELGGQSLSVMADGEELEFEAEAGSVEVGSSYKGARDFVEYIPGDLPLIITASHGGTERPDDIPTRTGNVVTVRDLATDTLGFEMADALEDEVGGRPHLVVLHLHRTRLDANREIGEAAQGHSEAERAWHEFHSLTELSKEIVREEHGQGFLLDLHGHGKDPQWLELGYLLTLSDLEASDDGLNDAWAVEKSSLRTLAEEGGVDHAELVRGETSLGDLYEEEGYSSVPSSENPDPESNPFFSGGHITQRHGCRDGDEICAFQLELNWDGVRDSRENHRAFVEANARVLDTFFGHHYGAPLSDF